METHFSDMLSKKYFQTIWKKLQKMSENVFISKLWYVTNTWGTEKNYAEKLTCEKFDRKIMATKKLHICLLEIKKWEKERKEKKEKMERGPPPSRCGCARRNLELTRLPREDPLPGAC